MKPTSQLSTPVYLPPSTLQGSPSEPSPLTVTQTLVPQGSPSIIDTAVHFSPRGQSCSDGSHWPPSPPSCGWRKLLVVLPVVVVAVVAVVVAPVPVSLPVPAVVAPPVVVVVPVPSPV